MNIILHLGGTYHRAETAAKLAVDFPESIVVVSSEGGDYMSIYKQAGIEDSRIIVDDAAWDTVTNFTHTYKLLNKLDCTRLFVVTDMFHCYRAELIAFACWGGRVPIYIIPHRHNLNEKDEGYAMGDFWRALCWRLTGILPFWKSVREARCPGYKTSTEHARLEIGL